MKSSQPMKHKFSSGDGGVDSTTIFVTLNGSQPRSSALRKLDKFEFCKVKSRDQGTDKNVENFRFNI